MPNEVDSNNCFVHPKKWMCGKFPLQTTLQNAGHQSVAMRAAKKPLQYRLLSASFKWEPNTTKAKSQLSICCFEAGSFLSPKMNRTIRVIASGPFTFHKLRVVLSILRCTKHKMLVFMVIQHTLRMHAVHAFGDTIMQLHWITCVSVVSMLVPKCSSYVWRSVIQQYAIIWSGIVFAFFFSWHSVRATLRSLFNDLKKKTALIRSFWFRLAY